MGVYSNVMVQKRVAFEKTKQQQEASALSDISPKWAKRLGERQQLPVPMSITTCLTAENVMK